MYEYTRTRLHTRLRKRTKMKWSPTNSLCESLHAVNNLCIYGMHRFSLSACGWKMGKENDTWCLKVTENSAAPLKQSSYSTHTHPRLQLTYFWRAIEKLNFLIFLLSVGFFFRAPATFVFSTAAANPRIFVFVRICRRLIVVFHIFNFGEKYTTTPATFLQQQHHEKPI